MLRAKKGVTTERRIWRPSSDIGRDTYTAAASPGTTAVSAAAPAVSYNSVNGSAPLVLLVT